MAEIKNAIAEGYRLKYIASDCNSKSVFEEWDDYCFPLLDQAKTALEIEEVFSIAPQDGRTQKEALAKLLQLRYSISGISIQGALAASNS